MAWNIAVLVTPGLKVTVGEIIPDVFVKTSEGLLFEDATSATVGTSLTVGIRNDDIIIIDVLGRFVEDETYPMQVAKQNGECKVFYISENPVFRSYKHGERVKEAIGIGSVKADLEKAGIEPLDEWGETMVFQLLEHEAFKVKKREGRDHVLWDVKYDLYELK
jgi:hypothetical protein